MNGLANSNGTDDKKGILHLTSGEIVVESEKGKGSKFTITPPMELKQ